MLNQCKQYENIQKEDFRKVADKAGLKKLEAEKCIEEVKFAVSRWSDFADEAELSSVKAERISKFFK